MPKTPEEKHLEIMLAICEINTTIKKVIEPAVGQADDNKDDIIRIIGFQKVIKYVGGLTVVTTASLVGKMIYGFISKHPPPPNIPH